MLNKDTLKPLLKQQIDGIIWKLVLDDEQNCLAIESRTLTKQVLFSVYDFNQKCFLILNYSFEEKWQLGLLALYQHKLILHGFENEFAPTQKNILVFNLVDKNIGWENYSHTAQAICKEGIMAYNARIMPRKLELLDLNTGSSLGYIKANETLQQLQNHIILPDNKPEENIWETAQQLIYKDLFIRSLYLKNKDSYTQIIEVYDKENNILLSDILNDNIQKLVEDTFFVWLGKLVYIRNKSEIVSYLL
ncbi:DUF4905 domain-containing protein [Pedobacter puniceum]|uniref:DUF4905 domain-containing protein n=1 Tax=Pedobacter puniceum TaxID=2666136 RepID=A0A7K0FSP6_9SPHI|nr:DUF4905 domain-containing protein [Pedobacter puniceum]MRX48320.1 DUF4905 domain-containing protein [Pedobacter puniceum]